MTKLLKINWNRQWMNHFVINYFVLIIVVDYIEMFSRYHHNFIY